jgi:hypothetical protein
MRKGIYVARRKRGRKEGNLI